MYILKDDKRIPQKGLGVEGYKFSQPSGAIKRPYGFGDTKASSDDDVEKKKGMAWWWWLIIALVVLLVVGVGIYMWKKQS